jgi:putative methanogenesis marker protein 17
MHAVEYFEVECPEPLGGEFYKQIANDVLLDHNLLRVIHKLHIYVDPGVPIFVAVGVFHKITSLVRVRDFAAVNPLAGKIMLALASEMYLAPMLKIFLSRFGQDHVEQSDRFTVILRDVTVDPREVEEIVVADPSESVFKDLIYALKCIAPEGFRVRRELYSKEKGKFFFVASEDTLAADVDALVQAKFAKMGEEMP